MKEFWKINRPVFGAFFPACFLIFEIYTLKTRDTQLTNNELLVHIIIDMIFLSMMIFSMNIIYKRKQNNRG